MKTKAYKRVAAFILPSAIVLTSLPAGAQLPGVAERVARRGARQLQRQVNRWDYYPQQTWNELNPWIKESGITPIERTANAVRQTVDAATRVGDGQFGFRDRANDNAWFYDYYSYTPTYYATPTDDRYSSAVRYFDRDNDGVYDWSSRYRDSNSDGQYDEFDRYDYYSSNSSRSESDSVSERERDSLASSDRSSGPRDARRHSVSGEVTQIKTAKVNGGETLVVGVQSSEGKLQPVDLGSVEQFNDLDVKIGTAISAMGPMEQIGDKSVLIANTVRLTNGQSIDIERTQGQELQGTIVSVKNTSVESTDHYLAVVDVDGERQLVDLGPTEKYDGEIQPQTQIRFRGIPVRSGDYRVTIAQRIGLNGRTIVIQ